MMRGKRPAVADVDNENDSEITPSPPDSSSPSGSEARKRRRITENSDTTPEHGPDESTQMTGQNQFESDTDDESDEAEEAATQVVQERKARTKNTGNVAKESGVLDNVILINFMCHRHFEYKLGPLINFICGKNGSGKSAILTAIILCLGGKASATNRGASLRRFIKEGEERASITCKIRNRGEDAYMPDTYGGTIIVERHFTRSGSAGYKIMSESRKTISTKRADLEAIVDHFSLQIDNPLNVLSQDMARSFIGSSNSGEKYKFFIKGVQLERLDQDYQLLHERIEEMAPKLSQKKEDVRVLQSIAKEKKRQRDLAAKRDGLSDQIRDLRRQAFWAKVIEAEKIVADYDASIAEIDAKIVEVQAQAQELEDTYQKADQMLQQYADARAEASQALDIAKEEQRQAQNVYDEAKAEAVGANAELRNVGDSLKAATESIKAQKAAIVQEENRLLEVNGGGAARRLQELEAARDKAQQAKEDLLQHKAGRGEAEKAIKQADLLAKDKQGERDSISQSVQQQRQKLRELQENRNRHSNAFRPNSERLEALIEQETRWQHKPIGPLGKHVRLLRPEWSSIIESMFGRSLADFIVFNKRDSDILNELKRRVNCDAGVVIINQNPFTPREPDDQFDTILRVLDIDNEYVKKYLIIQHAIEQHLLIPNIEEATSAMYDRGRLRNVRGCFAFSPHDRTKGVLLKYTASGEPSQDPVRAWLAAPRMKSDQEATIAAKRSLLEEAEKQLGAAEAAYKAARMERAKMEAARHRHQKRADELNLASQEADDAVQKLQEAIEEDNVESGKLEALKTGLREAEEQRQLAEEQYKDAVNARDAKNRTMREHNQRLSTIKEGVAELQQQSEEAQGRLRTADAEKHAAMFECNNGRARVKDAEKDRERAIAQRDEALANAEDIARAARDRSGSDRVHVPDDVDYDSLCARIKKLQADRERYHRELGFTRQEAAEEAAKAETSYAQSKKDFEELQEAKEMLEASLGERRARWHKFRRSITARAKVTFVYLLSERGFRGRILVDHRNHRLDLLVEPDVTRRSDQGRSAKTLSGGEKSFSQICLLLSIWEAMGSPIRCLDEFDVFMDAVNRNMSVKMIIEAARESVGKQYILISPGSKADIVRAPDVAVIDLGSPKRAGEDVGQRSIQVEDGVMV